MSSDCLKWRFHCSYITYLVEKYCFHIFEDLNLLLDIHKDAYKVVALYKILI